MSALSAHASKIASSKTFQCSIRRQEVFPAVQPLTAFVKPLAASQARRPASWGEFEGVRGMAVGKRGVPAARRVHLKEEESKERRKQLAREAKARNATDMDRHVLQAYKELEKEEANAEAAAAPNGK